MHFSPYEVFKYFQEKKKNVWSPPGHQKACSNKGASVLHISILIEIKKLSGDVTFTCLKHFYILLTFSHLLKKWGF